MAAESLQTAVDQEKKHDVLYSCGLLLNHAIQGEAARLNPSVDIFSIWNNYSENIAKSGNASKLLFFDSIKPLVSEQFLTKLKSITDDKDVASGELILSLLGDSDNKVQ